MRYIYCSLSETLVCCAVTVESKSSFHSRLRAPRVEHVALLFVCYFCKLSPQAARIHKVTRCGKYEKWRAQSRRKVSLSWRWLWISAKNSLYETSVFLHWLPRGRPEMIRSVLICSPLLSPFICPLFFAKYLPFDNTWQCRCRYMRSRILLYVFPCKLDCEHVV